jgi:two-component system OmpR family sensor kinase
MARAAGSISALDLKRRLPRAGTSDELDELGTTFNELLDRLQISFEKQSRFASEASHQLRTPLAAIVGQLDVALRRDRTAEEYREALTSAQKQAGQLTRIVEMLMFLTREDADVSSPALERVELRSWLGEHLQGWGQHARSGDIQMDVSSDQPLWVNVHSEMLGQALDNLLDNACKYSEPSSAIQVSVEQIGSAVRLTVEDNGMGVAGDELPQLGKAFFRSTRARERGTSGVGLGLAVVNRILAALGGQLQIERRPGTGSRFVIVLPTAARAALDKKSLTQPVA